jgi:hypothetical protein
MTEDVVRILKSSEVNTEESGFSVEFMVFEVVFENVVLGRNRG